MNESDNDNHLSNLVTKATTKRGLHHVIHSRSPRARQSRLLPQLAIVHSRLCALSPLLCISNHSISAHAPPPDLRIEQRPRLRSLLTAHSWALPARLFDHYDAKNNSHPWTRRTAKLHQAPAALPRDEVGLELDALAD